MSAAAEPSAAATSSSSASAPTPAPAPVKAVGRGGRAAKLNLSEAVKQQDLQEAAVVAESKQDELQQHKKKAGRRTLLAAANATVGTAGTPTAASASPSAASGGPLTPSAASGSAGSDGTLMDAALAAASAAEDARAAALSSGASESEARAAQQRAADAALTPEQRSNAQLQKLLLEMSQAEASKEVHNARQLSSAEEAMMRKMQRGKTTKQQKLIEKAFQSSSLVEQFQGLERDKQAAALADKLAKGKAKKKMEPAAVDALLDGAGDDPAASAPAASGGGSVIDEALRVMQQLSELKDEALADGKIRNEADSKKVHAQALEATLTDEQKSNATFMQMLQSMTEAEASKEVHNARQMSAAEEAMMRKMQKGKSTAQAKLIEAAFSNQSVVEEMQRAQARAQEDAMAAKMAAAAKKRQQKAAAASAEEKQAPDGVDAAAAAAEAAELEELRKKKKAGSKLKAAVAAAADSSANLDTMVAACIYAEEAREQATKQGRTVSAAEIAALSQKSVEEHLNDEQQAAQSAFLDSLRSTVSAALAHDLPPARDLAAADEGLMRKLKMGRTLKQQVWLEKAFRDPSTVAALQALETQKSDDASIARLLQNKAAKKKEMAALAAAADSAAHFDALLTALVHLETARDKAVGEGRAAASLTEAEIAAAQQKALDECLTAEQRGAPEFLATFRETTAAAAGRAPATPRVLNAADEAFLSKLKLTKPSRASQHRLLETLFHDAELLESLRALEAQKATDASVARTLVAKNKKKREQQAAEQAAEEAAEAAVAEEIAERKAETKAASDASAVAEVAAAVGVDGAAEFAAMLKQVSEQQANQDLAKSRQQDAQQEALMKKLGAGKSTKQKKLIEKAFAEAGLAEKAVSEQAKKQDDLLAAKLAAGKKKRASAAAAAATQQQEEKYSEPAVAASASSSSSAASKAPAVEPPVVVDYLEQKYGEMLADEERAAAEAKAAKGVDPAKAILENQEAIAEATNLGMNAGANGVAVAQIAAQAAAMGLTPEQITAAAQAAAQISALGDSSDADHATFMDLFRKATEDAAAEQLRRKQGRDAQEDAFALKIARGKRTKQQQMVDKQMADIMAANAKARAGQSAQEQEMAKRLAAGKRKKAQGAQGEEANRLAAEALASEMLVSNDSLQLTAGQQSAAALREEIAQILAAPTIMDELLAVSDAQSEEIERQARESGLSIEEITAANKEALELDNMAAQLMLEKAREAEANGDAEGAAAFMDMYRRMIDENLRKDSAMKRQLSDAESALMAKLKRGKTTKQQKMIDAMFANQSLVDAIMNQEAARQQALFEAKLANKKSKKKDPALLKAAEDAFAKLRKIFLGAIKKLDAANIIRALEEHRSLIDQGYLDLNRPIKESGESMLHQAAKYGRGEVVEWLVKFGQARPNLPNLSAQQTPLHFAALALDPDSADQITPENAATACMVLIESGGDVLARDVMDETPLSIAAKYGFDLSNLANSPQAQEALMRQRAREDALALKMQEEEGGGMMSDVSSEDASKAAAIAAQVAADAAAKLAAELAAGEAAALPIDPATGLPMTESQVALQREELELLMNEEKLELMVPLVAAPAQDSKKTKAANLVFLQLCELFKDIGNQRNELEAAALIKANVELIREGYLDLSRPVKNKQDGSTLLHAAVFHQKLNLVRQLLQNRADPNKITMTGETPLHVACSLADREPHGKAIVSLLLEAGANPLLRDFKSGLSCFEHAPNAALKTWMQEWKPLAERQRLALASQMGGLDDLLASRNKTLKNAAYNAESSFLDKLMRGKLTKQQKLIDEAMRNADSVGARNLTEQQRQLEAMNALLARGKRRKPGQLEDSTLSSELSGSKSELAARKKAAFMEDMLLAELSEPTQDKIMLTAEKWADHPAGLSGLDIAVLSKLRGMPIADALKLLSTELSATEQNQLKLAQAIHAPGLDETQALEYERQFNIADCNHSIYTDLTNNMLEAERKRQEALREQAKLDNNVAMTDEDIAIQRARERLEEIARKKEAALLKAQQNKLPAGMLEQICVLFSQYIALNTGYEVEPQLILEGALPLDDLQSYNLDVDTITTMLAATEVDPAKRFIERQTEVNQAVSANIAQQLADESLPAQQREEAEIHSKLCATNADLYSKILAVLDSAGDPNAAAAHAAMLMEESVDMSNQRAADESASKDGNRGLVHPDTGLSVQMRIQDVVLEQLRELAAEFLGMQSTELSELSVDQLQQALAKAGVHVDVLEELRKLTEAEAGKWLAKEMAKNEAESEMLRRLLNGKGLSEKKRAELLARQKALDSAAGLYNDLLSTLLSGQKTKYAHMSAEEQAAQDRMLAKLAARRRKQEAQELADRKKRQEDEITHEQELMRESHGEKLGKQVLKAVTDADGNAVLDETGAPQMALVMEEAFSGEVAGSSEILSKGTIMHQLLMDNPAVFESLQTLAAEHLGIAANELMQMEPLELQMLLAEKGVDFNLLDYLKTLSNEEAAKHLAREMARAEAEAKMLRKLLQGKGLSPEQREELLARQRALDDNAKLYEDMLRNLLSAEQKKFANMTAAEKAAYDAMQAKLALRKAREVAKAKEASAVDENSPILDLFDDLAPKGPWDCRVCKASNAPTVRACTFCKRSRAETLALPEMTLWTAHRMLHQCSCAMSVIEVIHRSIGPCTKRNFLHFMQATLIACNRDSHVYWDAAGVDAQCLGALDPLSSELVWGFNEWDIESARFHTFVAKSEYADMDDGFLIGRQDFRDECVQMPNIQDYQ